MTGNKINGLIYMAERIGSNPAYVQGGGGNISVKLDDTRMAIKASGGLLKEMTLESGYCIVDYRNICEYLSNPDADENTFTQKIKSFVLDTNDRPSMETGFHAQLGNCVIHTHTIYANLLTCSKEGKEFSLQLFPGATWIGYVTPGRDLTLAVKKALAGSAQMQSIVFLQNHGLIVAGDTPESTVTLHREANTKIMDFFDLPDTGFDEKVLDVDLDFINEHILFPDQVVYTLADEKILKTSAATETLAAYSYILNAMKEKELTPNYISKEKRDILINMESEKYRQKAIKK